MERTVSLCPMHCASHQAMHALRDAQLTGELLSEEDNERLFALCRDREASFKGQRWA